VGLCAGCSVMAGIHPDEVAEAIVDAALIVGKPLLCVHRAVSSEGRAGPGCSDFTRSCRPTSTTEASRAEGGATGFFWAARELRTGCRRVKLGTVDSHCRNAVALAKESRPQLMEARYS
jgi:hypothetical protein